MVSDPADAAAAHLREARRLNEARAYPALVRLLDGLPGDAFEQTPELAFLQADVHRRLGRAAEALEQVRRLEAVCRMRGNDRLARMRANLEGMLLFDRGDVAEAERVWVRLLDASTEARDDEFVARATNNLGVIFSLQRRGAEALAALARAIDAYRRLDHLRGLAQSHQNLAITYREMGFPGEADRHFSRALEYAERDGSADEAARVEQEMALSQLLWGDADLARATATRALDRYEKLGDPVGQGECRRVYGLIHLRAADGERAEQELRAALELAMQGGAALLEAELLEALAGAARLRAQRREARRLRGQATRTFRALGAGAWARAARERIDGLVEAAANG